MNLRICESLICDRLVIGTPDSGTCHRILKDAVPDPHDMVHVAEKQNPGKVKHSHHGHGKKLKQDKV